MPHLRPSTEADLPAITAIYAHHVLHGTGSFEIEPPSVTDMAQRRTEVLGRHLPWLVAVSETGDVLGFAYANWFRPRAAFRYSAEDSIYLAEAAQGQGLGRVLLQALCDEAQARGVRKMVALIGDSANAASLGLHRALGFEQTGLMRSVGWKFGAWRDIVLMEKTLGEGDRSSPE